ncbi:hypothetical protein Dda_5863 [Drechslerella dactyloides]|uniref:DNA polymerase delta subunit 4 n=1 Tax=Drechslerella dactyloides TaxID=74499 RepID=A0AAD6NJE9_DREDA|nr:hypothetical protein Dda_5863 [Drechslerella dactyloides]
MPVSTRHSAAAPANAGGQQQSKLNFSTKKPTTTPAHLKAKQHLDAPASAKAAEPPKTVDVTVDDDAEETVEAEVTAPVADVAETETATADADAAEAEVEVTEFQEEVIERPKIDFSTISQECADEAYDVTSEQISQYYKSIKNARIAPPVHQEGLTDYEKILRHFDLSSQYGPCIGSTTRLQRWSRAHRFNLHPPIEVLAVLLKSELAPTAPPPPSDKKWKVAPAAAREGVGATAYVNKLLDTHRSE